MTDDQIEVARALVAAEWWEWRSGMRTADGDRLTWLQRDREDLDGFDDAHNAALTAVGLIDGDRWLPAPADIPDLTDSATGGVLLSMLAEAIEARCLLLRLDLVPHRPEWFVWYGPIDDEQRDCSRSPWLAEACAKALLAVHAVR